MKKNRFNCEHKKQRYERCDLVKIGGNRWTTQHYFRCWECGKIIAGKRKGVDGGAINKRRA